MIPDRVVTGRSKPAVFTDQEIALFLSEEGGDVRRAAANGCEVIGLDEERRKLSVSISSGMSISRSGGAAAWLQRAKQLREDAAKIPWEIVESAAIEFSKFGEDNSHYVGDPECEE
jgi:hypothetical protein